MAVATQDVDNGKKKTTTETQESSGGFLSGLKTAITNFLSRNASSSGKSTATTANARTGRVTPSAGSSSSNRTQPKATVSNVVSGAKTSVTNTLNSAKSVAAGAADVVGMANKARNNVLQSQTVGQKEQDLRAPIVRLADKTADAFEKVDDILSKRTLTPIQQEHMDATFKAHSDVESVMNKIRADHRYAATLVDAQGNLIDYSQKIAEYEEKMKRPSYARTKEDEDTYKRLKEIENDQSTLYNYSAYQTLVKEGASKEQLNQFKRYVNQNDMNGVERALAEFGGTYQGYLGNYMKGKEYTFQIANRLLGVDYRDSKTISGIIDDAESLQALVQSGSQTDLERVIHRAYGGVSQFLYGMAQCEFTNRIGLTSNPNIPEDAMKDMTPDEILALPQTLSGKALTMSDIGVFGSTMKKNLEDGRYGYWTCVRNAAFHAALNDITESIGGERWANLLMGEIGTESVSKGLSYIIRSSVQAGVAEGIEEMAEGLADPIIDYVSFGGKDYLKQYTNPKYWGDVGVDMFYGFIGGLALASGTSVSQVRDYRNSIDDLVKTIEIRNTTDYAAAKDVISDMQELILNSKGTTETDAKERLMAQELVDAYRRKIEGYRASNPYMDAFKDSAHETADLSNSTADIMKAAQPTLQQAMDEIVAAKEAAGEQGDMAVDAFDEASRATAEEYQRQLNEKGIDINASVYDSLDDGTKKTVGIVNEWAKASGRISGDSNIASLNDIIGEESPLLRELYGDNISFNNVLENGLNDYESLEVERNDKLNPITKQVVDELGLKGNIQASISSDTDSDGNTLTDDQKEYFKDSKVRNDEGKLIKMYTGSDTEGITSFDPSKAKDGISTFFTDNPRVADTYVKTDAELPVDYSYNTYKSIEDFNSGNSFTNERIGVIDADTRQKMLDYETERIGSLIDGARTKENRQYYQQYLKERLGEISGYPDGKYYIYMEQNPYSARSELYDTAEEALHEFGTDDYLRPERKAKIYEAYLNLTNPLIIDAEGSNWNRLPSDFADADGNIHEAEATDTDMDGNFVSNTRTWARYAYDNGYDGVIFRNIYDKGSDTSFANEMSTVAVAFDPNQIKSVDNYSPTSDSDIRFSVSDDAKWQESAQKVLDQANSEQDMGELTIDDLDGILHQKKINPRTLEMIERTRQTMIDNVPDWVKGYDTIRAEFPMFSREVLNNAVYDVLVDRELAPETYDQLVNSLSSDYSLEGIEGDIRKDIDDFVAECINTFQNEIAYKSGETNRRAVSDSIRRNQAYGQSDIEGEYQKQTGRDFLNSLTSKIKQDYQAKYQGLTERLVELDKRVAETGGRKRFKKKKADANVSDWKTFSQNIDAIASGDADVHREMMDMIRYGVLDEAAKTRSEIRRYAQEDVINRIIELGIVGESEESKGLQYILEGHTEKRRTDLNIGEGTTQQTLDEYRRNPYQPYGVEDLKRDYSYRMKNGKMAYDNILEASGILRQAYDDIYRAVTLTQLEANGDVLGNASQELANLKVKVEEAYKTLENIKAEIVKDRSKPSTQAAYEIQKNRYNLLVNQYNKLVQKHESGDMTRRQLTPYRESYSHHIVKPSLMNDLRSIRDAGLNVPTELAGTSDTTKPNTAWASFSAAQEGGKYDPDAVSSYMSYMNEAADVVAYNPVILELRNFNKDIKGLTKGTQLNVFSGYLDRYCNMLAGKTGTFDRAIREALGPKALKTIEVLNRYAKAAALAGNIHSGLVQFANIPNGIAILSEYGGAGHVQDMAKGMASYISAMGKGSAIDSSPFMANRYFDFDDGQKGALKTIKNAADWVLTVGDKVGTEYIWWSAYNQAQRIGTDIDPIQYADEMARKSVASRERSDVPVKLQERLINLLIPFQVENNNLYQELKNESNGRKIGAIIEYNVAAFLFNAAIKAITGGDDEVLAEFITPIYEELRKQLKGEQDINQTATNILWGEIGEFISLLPAGSWAAQLTIGDEGDTIFGDYNPNRYGVSNIGLSGIGKAIVDIAKHKDDNRQQIIDAIDDLFAGYVNKQAIRTKQGLQSMGGLPEYKNGHIEMSPINYTNSGKIAYVNDQSNIADWIRAALFGKSSTSGNRGYVDSGFKTMSDKATNIFNAMQKAGSDMYDSYTSTKEYMSKASDKDKDNDINLRETLIRNGTYSDYMKTVTKAYEGYITEWSREPHDKDAEPKTFTQFANGYGITSKDLQEDTYKDFYDTYKVPKQAQKAFHEALDIKNTVNALGKTISNSAATQRRVIYEEQGIYSQILEYIEKNNLEYSDFGLTKTVVEYSAKQISNMLKKIGSVKEYTGTSSGTSGSSKGRSGRSSGGKAEKQLEAERRRFKKALIKGTQAMSGSSNVFTEVQKILDSATSIEDAKKKVKARLKDIR